MLPSLTLWTTFFHFKNTKDGPILDLGMSLDQCIQDKSNILGNLKQLSAQNYLKPDIASNSST